MSMLASANGELGARPLRDFGGEDAYAGESGYGVRLDPQKLLSAFRAHWRLFAVVVLAGFTACVATLVLMPKAYTAMAGVELVAPQKPDATGALQPAQPADPTTVDTEIQLVQSRAMARQVVQALGLEGDPAFWAAFHQTPPSDPVVRADEAVTRVQRALKAKRPGLTSVITLSATAGTPEMAARLANGYADQFLASQQAAKLAAARQSGQALSERLEQLRRQALHDAAALAAFRTAHDLYTDQGAGLIEQEAALFDEQLTQARADSLGDQSRLETARRQFAGETRFDGARGVAVDSPVLQNLRAQRAQLTARIADLQNRYGALHPDIIAVRKQIEDVDAGLAGEVGRLLSELQTRAEISRQRVSGLEQALGAARGRLAGAATAAVTLEDLQRKAESSRLVYQDYLARSEQASASVGTEQPDARITNRSDPPREPSSPKPALDLGLALMGSLGLGVFAVYGRTLLDSGLATGQEVEDRLGLPYLGSVPELASVIERADRGASAPDYLLAKPSSAFGEAVRQLRTSLRFAGATEGARILAVTSALPGEGKSTTSLCIARSAGQAGARVLLIDCDLRRRSLNRLLRLRPKAGLLDVLEGRAELADVLVRDEPSGAWVLPVAESVSSTEEVFDSPAMDALLREAASRFDLVVLDTAPVLAVAETRVLARKCDEVVFLTRWRRTSEKAVAAGLKLLAAAGAPVAGVALVQVNMRQQARYGHGDAGCYYAQYRRYYRA